MLTQQLWRSPIGVFRLPVHASGPHCQHIYDRAIAPIGSNDCCKPICLVYGTAVLCDAFAKECHLEIILLTYLLTYLLTVCTMLNGVTL